MRAYLRFWRHCSAVPWLPASVAQATGAGGRIRTCVAVRRRFYRPLELTTLPPLRASMCRHPRPRASPQNPAGSKWSPRGDSNPLTCRLQIGCAAIAPLGPDSAGAHETITPGQPAKCDRLSIETASEEGQREVNSQLRTSDWPRRCCSQASVPEVSQALRSCATDPWNSSSSAITEPTNDRAPALRCIPMGRVSVILNPRGMARRSSISASSGASSNTPRSWDVVAERDSKYVSILRGYWMLPSGAAARAS